jgi:short-subunit dehydrogenase
VPLSLWGSARLSNVLRAWIVVILPMKFLIYGATKGHGDGLGATAARRLSQRGHEVWGLCRNESKLVEAQDFPLEVIDLACESGQARLKELIRIHNPDAIWSACGSGHGDPLWVLPDAAIEEMIDANVRNNVLFCRSCAPSCLDGGPHLILTGSIAGVLDGCGASVYAGVKGFLIPFVRGQRAEYSRQGHHAKISLLMLNAVRVTGIDVLVDTLEFVARQSRAMEILIH